MWWNVRKPEKKTQRCLDRHAIELQYHVITTTFLILNRCFFFFSSSKKTRIQNLNGKHSILSNCILINRFICFILSKPYKPYDYDGPLANTMNQWTLSTIALKRRYMGCSSFITILGTFIGWSYRKRFCWEWTWFKLKNLLRTYVMFQLNRILRIQDSVCARDVMCTYRYKI